MLLVKHVQSQWDCFSGVGFDVHSRLMIDLKNKKAGLVYGRRLPKPIVQAIVDNMDTNKKYQNISE